MRKIEKIILHCTDSPDHMNIGFKEINQWHKERGWLSKSGISCGYHWIVKRNGKIEAGRPEKDVGSHCYGQNRTSIGVVWVGKDSMTIEQNQALISLLKRLITTHNLKYSDIFGHCEFTTEKTCPNVDMNTLRLDVLTARE